MDRIRKALDLAARERAAGPPVRPELVVVNTDAAAPKPAPGADAGAAEVSAAPEATGATAAPRAARSNGEAPRAILYSHTRVFAPVPAHLERNRVLNPDSVEPAATAFRMLRTQVLQRLDANGWRSLAIFSPGPHDGKTTTAINLAVSLATDRLHTVLLVDFDFTGPGLAQRLGISPVFGSDDALAGRAPVGDCLYHPEGFERLVVMPARGCLNNSSELLAGRHSRELVAELRGRYPERIIVYDLPPVLSADDALAFAPRVECGLLVAAEGRTRRADLVRTVELLHKTPLVGTVLNRASNAPLGY